MDVENRLKQIRDENIVWIIYFILIGICIYNNKIEKEYFLTGNEESKKLYRYINIFIFIVAILVYLYFFNSDYNAVKNLNSYDSIKKQNLTKLSFLGTTLILLSGFIFLYIVVEDQNIETEIAFN